MNAKWRNIFVDGFEIIQNWEFCYCCVVTGHNVLKKFNLQITGARTENTQQQSIQRQALGTVRPFEILQAQEIFIKARLDYLKAVADYNKAQYQLHVAKGNNL